MAEPVLQIEGLTKSYGIHRAIEDLSLTVEKGSVYGILGPNGSGKTTTLGIVLGVINRDAGTFSWFNGENTAAVRKRIGAILESPNFYHYLSGEENLKVAARIKGVPVKDIGRVLSIANLEKEGRKKFSGYSLGMKQRLAMASALLGDPEVLVLDEPTNGLDPQGIAEVRALIRSVAALGKTILFASHLLDEVEKVGTHVAVMKSGKLLACGPVKEVLSGHETIELASGDMTRLAEVMARYPSLDKLEVTGQMLMVSVREGSPADINRYLISQNITLSHLALRKKSLESQFLDLISKS